MKNKFILVLMTFLPSYIYAHTLLLNVYDNKNNTISVEGIFSTGVLASGAQIRLESLVREKILYKKRLPEEGELVIVIPTEPYEIILNGGPGHEIVKKGIAPIEGFNSLLKNQAQVYKNSAKPIKKDYSYIITLVSIIIACLLFILTIIINIQNTNKLMKQLKNNT